MNDTQNAFIKNVAKLIMTSASIASAWCDKDRDVLLNDITKDTTTRALGSKTATSSNASRNRNRNRNRNRARKGTTNTQGV
jgi:hypothetical protein